MSPRRRSYGTIRDASAYGGKVSTGERSETRPAGLLAWFDGECGRCDNPIQHHVHQVVERKGSWVHVGCVAGSRDGEDL